MCKSPIVKIVVRGGYNYLTFVDIAQIDYSQLYFNIVIEA